MLLALARDPGASLREIAQVCRLSPRTVQRILRDLTASGYLTRHPTGRSSRCTLTPDGLHRRPTRADPPPPNSWTPPAGTGTV
ncbi:winged helix-turn-helix domain-containing protein [Streptomyces sp. NPDC046939]|uniref:winged helix-turn-helix domain-containing protein n=1 Tax=Streptomyces sp. NPDC046939 TaxID=3155376 RepID=UPI0033EA7981